MLRHWGLLAVSSPAGLTRHMTQLSRLIVELASLLESLDNTVGNKPEEEKKEDASN